MAISLNECHCLLHFTVFVQNFFLIIFIFSVVHCLCDTVTASISPELRAVLDDAEWYAPWHQSVHNFVYYLDMYSNKISYTILFFLHIHFYVISVYVLFQSSYFFWALFHTIIDITMKTKKCVNFSFVYICPMEICPISCHWHCLTGEFAVFFRLCVQSPLVIFQLVYWGKKLERQKLIFMLFNAYGPQPGSSLQRIQIIYHFFSFDVAILITSAYPYFDDFHLSSNKRLIFFYDYI